MVAKATLVGHRGAREVSRKELQLVHCPSPQGRWCPVPFHTVLEYAERAFTVRIGQTFTFSDRPLDV